MRRGEERREESGHEETLTHLSLKSLYCSKLILYAASSRPRSLSSSAPSVPPPRRLPCRTKHPSQSLKLAKSKPLTLSTKVRHCSCDDT